MYVGRGPAGGLDEVPPVDVHVPPQADACVIVLAKPLKLAEPDPPLKMLVADQLDDQNVTDPPTGGLPSPTTKMPPFRKAKTRDTPPAEAGVKNPSPANSAKSLPAPRGWLTSSIEQMAAPVAFVVAVHCWAVAPVPSPRVTVRPATGCEASPVRTAFRASDDPFAIAAGGVSASAVSSVVTANAAEVDEAFRVAVPAKLAATE